MFVGIDVSKEWVDVAVLQGGEEWRVDRDQDGLDGDDGKTPQNKTAASRRALAAVRASVRHGL